MFYESSELQEIKDSVTKCANKLWPPSKHLRVHVKDGNWTGWITDVNHYISPVLSHCSLDSSIFILTPVSSPHSSSFNYHPWQKDCYNFRLSYRQDAHPTDLAQQWPLLPPHPGVLNVVQLSAELIQWTSFNVVILGKGGSICNSCCLRYFYFESRHGNVPFSEHLYPNIARIAKMQLSGWMAAAIWRLWPSPPRTIDDCLHLPLSSALIMIIILSRGLIQLARARYSPFKACTEHCCLLKGLCQNSPLPTPLVLTPRSDPPTHC